MALDGYLDPDEEQLSSGAEDEDAEVDVRTLPAHDTQVERDSRAALDARDRMAGFFPLPPVLDGFRAPERIGWLLNVAVAAVHDPASGRQVSALDCYFLSGDEGGGDFRVTLCYRPYFYVGCTPGKETDVESALKRDFSDVLSGIHRAELEDLDMLNHLATRARRLFLRVETFTTDDLVRIRSHLLSYANGKQNPSLIPGDLSTDASASLSSAAQRIRRTDPYENIVELREYDVPYVTRVCIDCDIRCGYWYRVEHSLSSGGAAPKLHLLSELVERANPTVLAYDIECTKAPLKFPDPYADDEIMMISWMLDGRGYLGVNRQIIAEDIHGFTYAPKPEFESSFVVFNEPDEASLLRRFLAEARAAQPRVYVTYNGDAFDWFFVHVRASRLGINILDEIGMSFSAARGLCRGRAAVHMDCIHWVNRDSYLPQGSRGLKAVTRALLGYEPHELDPEEMLTAARTRPQELAAYSVSDAVATYQLYMKYVQPFIFSLCNILPFGPDDVLRKGSGTLCESLLMCEAHRRNIVAPNKFKNNATERTFQSRLLANETYIGGHVEALQSGIYRVDLPIPFRIDTAAVRELQENLDQFLQFAIEREQDLHLEEITDYENVRADLAERLKRLAEQPLLQERPLILHLDVGAMYPNIILTNRLQPHACVTRETCAACDFNGTSDCRRKMHWVWRGECYPATIGEVQSIRASVLTTVRARRRQGEKVSDDDAEAMYRKRLREYCMKVHKRVLEPTVQTREAWICQRENPFYVDTVRAFRDRRYEYKRLLKQWRKALAESGGASIEARNMCIVYDSMQLAHKCILNSFYGYVMRRAARWYSMEMAGVVTQTGASIIRLAREWIERVGLPLELDTDGIWCAIPATFPNDITLHTRSGREISISLLCTVLNTKVAAQYTNHQYQEWSPDEGTYKQRSEFSIFFEIDGPYRAMVLPASREEGKSIKKRYAVFQRDGSLAEIKGFELKRRGELKLIKVLQSEIFGRFLEGSTLAECYAAVGETANLWLDVLDSNGGLLSDAELLELVAEQTHMSKPLAAYIQAGQKSSAITCAKRIQEFLGKDMVRDKGLACRYVIARYPLGTQVTERAIPVQIFSADLEQRQALLRKWLREPVYNFREILDWDYYRGRLANTVQRIISIPAACQGVPNPVPRIEHPDWLRRRLRDLACAQKQTTLKSFFRADQKATPDLEDIVVVKTGPLPRRQPCSDARGIANTSLLNAAVAAGAAGAAGATSSVDLARTVLETVSTSLKWTAAGTSVGFAHSAQEQVTERDASGSRLAPFRAGVQQVVQPGRCRPHSDAAARGEPPSSRPISYQQWLEAVAKPQWRLWVRQRRARRSAAAHPAGLRCRLSGLVLEHADLVEPLLVLGIRETGTFQTCRVWFQTSRGRVLSLPVHVPHELWLLYRRLPPDALGQPIETSRNRAWCSDELAVHTLTVRDASISEAQLTTMARDALCLHAGYLVGLYGVQVSPLLLAVASLGIVCVLKPDAAKQTLRALQLQGIALTDLDSVEKRKPADFASPSWIIVCGSHAKDRSGRGIWVIFSPDRIVLILVGSFRSDAETRSALMRLRHESSVHGDGSLQTLGNALNQTEIIHAQDWKRGLRLLGLTLANRFPGGARPPLLFLQTAVPVALMRRRVPALNNYPLAVVPHVAADCSYQPTGWEAPAMQRALQRVTALCAQLPLRFQLSDLYGVPIGNLSGDLVAETLDVAVARALLQRGWPLDWLHRGDSLTLDVDTTSDAETWPQVSVPGAYSGICIDLEIQDLPLVAILEADTLYAMDRSQAPSGSLLVQVLRPLVQTWVGLEANGDQSAALLTSHLHRWIVRGLAGRTSRMLCAELLHLIRKTFHHLMETLAEMNASVIHATPFRLMLCTHRRQLSEAKAYCRFLLESCRTRPVLRRLIFAPVLRYIRAAFWHDSDHYWAWTMETTPVQTEAEAPTTTTTTTTTITTTEAGAIPNGTANGNVALSYRLEYSWRDAEHWSAPARKQFAALAQGLLQHLALAGQEGQGRAPHVTAAGTVGARAAPAALTPLAADQIFFLVKQWSLDREPQAAAQDAHWLFRLLLLYRPWQEALLGVEHAVFRFLKCSPFAYKAKSLDASHRVIVLDPIVCSRCFAVNVAQLASSQTTEALSMRSCRICACPLSEAQLRYRVAGRLSALLQTYLVQDGLCDRCGTAQGRLLSDQCECSGSCTTSRWETCTTSRALQSLFAFWNPTPCT